MLSSLVFVRHPPSNIPDPEDIFSSALGSIFTDDLRNEHGDDADSVIVYKSPKYGELEFTVADPSGEDSRRKFAHYLWNAGVLMGELVGGRAATKEGERMDSGLFDNEEVSRQKWGVENWWVGNQEEKLWRVKNETVLELGAGWFEDAFIHG